MSRSYRVSIPRLSGEVEELIVEASVEPGEVELEEVLADGRRGKKIFRHDPAARVKVYSVLQVGKRDPRVDIGRSTQGDADDKKAVALELWHASERVALYELVRIAHRGPLNFIPERAT